ncbi:hypothetical protein TOPH_03669 [Tolypocladium ophioglossoides CBS 100239]|uniref:Uncharacterized protein n=1 Tax=Tolypocladium ophioglossoides (strain CBS 100239) TaxID=1163406 RepID=A0A0L0NC31_TOLOC|nr:hypothetical protein TOPH_03669 [Tolypocladium ophioglossoides CBS 100239]
MEKPPSYGDSNELEQPGDDRALPPATLYVAGRFVHSDDPQAPPLYELSHSVGFLSDNDRVVRLERLDYTVRQYQGTPQVSTRARHVYDLTHPTLATSPTFAYHAEATSRRSLCSFGMESFRARTLSSAKGYRVHRAARGPDHRLVGREELFTAVPARDEAVVFEWYDARGGLLARETDNGELLSLLVSAEMGPRERDALVAAWILRVWWEMARDKGLGRWDDGAECP